MKTTKLLFIILIMLNTQVLVQISKKELIKGNPYSDYGICIDSSLIFHDFNSLNDYNRQIFWDKITSGDTTFFNMPTGFTDMQRQQFSIPCLPVSTVSIDSFLYVGYPNPNDTLLIEDTTQYFGCSILVLNNGVLIMKNSSVNIYGSLIAINNGKILVDSTQLHLNSVYEWQFAMASLDSALIRITKSVFDYGGFAGYTYVNDNSSLYVENSNYTGTTSLFNDNAIVTYKNVTGGGEYSARDSSVVHFSNAGYAIIHVQVPESSVVNMDFGTSTFEFVEHWEMNPSSPNASGIGYTIVIDSTNCMFNPSCATGSELTLTDSECSILVRFTQPVSDTISGLIDHTYYDDWFAPFNDRTIHLVNTTIPDWHIQTFSTSNIWVKNSIISEFICFDSSNAYLSNSIHDGIGGPLTAGSHSHVYVSYSDIRPNTVKVRNNGFLSIFNCTVWHDFIVAEDGLAVVLGSYYLNPIRVFNSGTAVVSGITSPATAVTEDDVPIIGDAYIERTPSSPYNFDAYRVYYTYYPFDTIINPDSIVWTHFTEWIPNQVHDDILAVWNTSGFEVGRYFLKLEWRELSGAVVYSYYQINLFINTHVEDGSGMSVPGKCNLFQNYPNPFSRSTTIGYQLPVSCEVDLKIFNMIGQEVRILVNGNQSAGEHSVVWDGKDETGESVGSGIYFYQFNAGNKFSETKKLLLLK